MLFSFPCLALPEDPEFTDVIENITVPAGRNIKLACSVKNLGTYKVNERKKLERTVFDAVNKLTASITG